MVKQQTGFVLLGDIGKSPNATSLGNMKKWNAEAEALRNALKGATILDAIRYIEKHPPSVGCVAMLSYVAEDMAKSEQASAGAKAKRDNDPRQKEKQLVFQCWQKWQSKPSNYKTKAAFAKDMLDKSEHLTSQKKIEDWCREWERKSGILPAK
jgi:hypothetical protein